MNQPARDFTETAMHSRYFRYTGLLTTVLMAGPIHAADAPEGVAVGYDSTNGQVLLGELNCTACHTPGSLSEHILTKQSPILAGVGSRVTPQYLRAYLTDPQAVKPGTPMPNLLHGIPDNDRSKTVDELVHYLASLVEQGDRPLDQRESGTTSGQIELGKELYHSVGCVACHQPYEAPPEQKRDPSELFDQPRDPEDLKGKASPIIPHGDLAMKTTVDKLAAFLRTPHHTRPSGRMPSFHLKPEEARMIAAYLLRDQYSETEQAPGTGLDVAVYRGAYGTIPDFTPLKPIHEASVQGFDLEAALPRDKQGKKPQSNFAVRFHGIIDVPTDGKYIFWTRSDDASVLSINGTRVVDNDGVHAPQDRSGEVILKKGRHEIELGFAQVGGGYELTVKWQPPGARDLQPIPADILRHATAAMIPKGLQQSADFQVDPNKAEAGKVTFGKLGCASCHAVERDVPLVSSVKANSLEAVDLLKGCLSDEVKTVLPKYALADAQRAALRASLAELRRKKEPPSTADRIAHTMTSMNCYACHQRDNIGGPDPKRGNYFGYRVLVDLGDEGRLPPPLTGVGAKFTPEGWEDALYSGKSYRSYMATRMPHFGKENIGHLPDLFEKVDPKVAERKPPFSGQMVDDGRFMVGKQALGCINCHAWGGYRLPGAEGLDFLQVPRRLKPGWTHAYILDPQKFKPGTRMPAGWPEGQSFFKDIQDGDANKQIDAVWAYLAAGTKGGLPAGLAPEDDSVLVPAEEPIVFRTFLDQVGAHSIMVGFRQRTHVAFDANRVRTVVAWAGDFATTRPTWDGRAGQYTPIPSNEKVWLPDGPPFTVIASESDPWPKDVPKKSGVGADRTPDGWKYLGYTLDKERVPTFRYRFEDVTVEERPSTEYRQQGAFLKRTFRLTSDKPPSRLLYRVAAGDKITQEGDVWIVDEKYRYRITGAGSEKPIVRESEGKQELIVPVPFTDKKAAFEVELVW